ncbi:hypothetical protein V8C42DRAFT_352616 [Trichoderma barbatum]
MSISTVATGRGIPVVHDKISDTAEKSLWQKAYDAADETTKEWIESLPDSTTSHGVDMGDQSWVEELVKIVRQLEKKHQDSSLRMTVGQKEISLKDYVAPTMVLLTTVGDISTQFTPAPSGMIWSAVKVFLQLPVTGMGETIAILATAERVLNIIRREKIYEVVFTADDSIASELWQNLTTALVVLYDKSLDLLAYAARYLKNKYRQILEWITNPGHAKSLMAELIQCETDVARAAECCELARSADADQRHTELLSSVHCLVDRIDDEIRRLFDEMESQKMLEALDYFSNVKFGEQHQKKAEMRTPGTGTWLLAHSKFKEWEHVDRSSILWLQGTVGMGKSFLASTVIDQFLVSDASPYTPNRKSNHGLAYFYCERGSADLREPISVLRCYVRQLSSVPCYPNSMQKKLIELYQESRKQGDRLSTQRCIDQLFASVNLYPRTTLILDGLDECNPDERWKLIEILAQLVAEVKNPVKLFISSRREQDIAKLLERSPIIEVDARDNQQDIRKFVEEKIERIEKTGNWISISQDFKIKIKDTICAKSDGMFRWAYLQMDQLSKIREENSLKERLGKLPKTLNAAYEEIFQRIEENGGGKTLERAVKWVMCVQYPLRTREILAVVRFSMSVDGKSLKMDRLIAEETLLGICGHLIVKDSNSDRWKFPHASSLEQAHAFVAQICLLYLLEYGTFGGKISEVNRNDSETYAMGRWATHVSALEERKSHEADVSRLLKRFLGIGKPLQKAILYPNENPIFGICLLGLYHLLEDYWASGIDVFQVNGTNKDLLSIAALCGHFNICKKLIELGSDVNKQLSASTYHSALASAMRGNHPEIVKFFISQGADPNFPLNGHSALCASVTLYARRYGNTCTEILLEARADPNNPCGPGCRFAYALENAAFYGYIKIGRLLLKSGADATLLSETGDNGSALAAAARRGDEAFCQLLIDHGADVNAHLKCGRYGSALAAAAAERLGTKAVQFLIELGADVNAPLEYGEFGSALAAAAIAGDKENCRLLIEHGADVNMPLRGGKYGSALAAALDSVP